jgi:signal transduction histidine kinase
VRVFTAASEPATADEIAMRPGLTASLMLVYAAVVSVLLLSTWWSYRSLAGTEHSARQLAELSVSVVRLTSGLETIVQDKGRIADYLISGDPELLNGVRPHRSEFKAWLEEMTTFTTTSEEGRLLEAVRATYASYTEKADEVVSLQQAGQDDAAHRLFVAMARDVETLLGDSGRLFALVEGDLQARRVQAQQRFDDGERAIAWITAIGALFSLVLGFILSRYAARPIYRLAVRLGSAGIVDEVALGGDDIGKIEARVSALLERVRQQERALQQAEKLSELGEIATEIAHETLNPVAGVKGMLQALRRTDLPPQQLSQELASMERQLDRVEGIVRRLMDYARPLEPHARRVAVRALLDDALRAARSAPSTRDHDVRIVSCASGLEWTLDPDLIRQVLVNLITNGCEASPPGSAVEVRAAVQGGNLLLAVEDHGSGITSASRERLFRPFFTTKPRGNGLGLAVSRKIVREHGGQIEAVPLTAAGMGSAFCVELPPGHGESCASPS